MLSSALENLFLLLPPAMVSATNTVMNGTGCVFPITFKLPGFHAAASFQQTAARKWELPPPAAGDNPAVQHVQRRVTE